MTSSSDAAMRSWLRRRRATTPDGIPRVDRGAPLPASAAQRLVWLQSQRKQAQVADRVPRAYRLRGSLDLRALSSAFESLVARHELLRGTFAWVDGTLLLTIGDSPPVDPTPEVAPGGAEAEKLEWLRDRCQRAMAAPFDLERGPLLRVRLFRLDTDDHVLLLVCHHIVVDAWSMALIHGELMELYAATTQGRSPRLPVLDAQYADFAAWHWRLLESDAARPHLDYWRERLRGARDEFWLPTDRPPPVTPSFRGGWRPMQLGSELCARVDALAEREGVTAFMVLLAAFSVLLSRWSGLADLVIGTGATNRVAETESLVGYFVSLLPLRLRIDERCSFADVLAHVRDAVLDARDHMNVSFERLSDELGHPHSLVQVAFGFENEDPDRLALEGLDVSNVEVANPIANFPLTLTLTRRGEGFRGGLQFAIDLFDSATMDRLAERYEALLAAVTCRPHDRLDDRDWLSDPERRLLARWSGGGRTRRPGRLPHVLLRDRAAREPARPAVRSHGTSLTWLELEVWSSQLARQLMARGVGPEVVVGVHLPREPNLIVTMLAVLKAGACYLPLDPAYPPERLRFIIADAQASVVVSTQAHWSDWMTGVDLVWLDDARLDGPTTSDATVWPEAHEESAGYLIYTSGSTGVPKGVAVTRRNWAQLANVVERLPVHDAAGSALAVASPSFDASIWEVTLALTHGQPLWMMPRPDDLDWQRQLEEARPSTATLTPSLLASWPQELDSPSLLVVAGETFPEPLAAAWSRRARLLNAYGPTEATICATWADAGIGDNLAGIGRPVEGAQILVLDRQLRQVPPGVPGELHIAGQGVSRGYLARPGLTAACFVPNPFAGPGTRMYRTGDRARWREDGTLQFLGRLDCQIKLAGNRVELGEVEAVVAGVPGVRHAAACLVPSTSQPSLGVAVLLEPTAPPEITTSIRQACERALPSFMVPARIACLEALPVTTHGKIDRAGLGAMLAVEQASAASPPSDPEEVQLAAIWEHVLGRPQDDRDRSFFEAGGNSLLAGKVVTAVRRELRVKLSVKTFFAIPTIRQLADEVRRLRGATMTPT